MATRRMTNRLPQFLSAVEQKAARGVTQALILGASEASVMTPVDTNTLLNGQYRKAPEKIGNKIVGTVGYTAEYAKYVHDPNVKQRFRRSTAEKEFLRKGFEESEPNIRAVITGAIKT